MNEKLFSGKEKNYAVARPHYPAALFNYMIENHIVKADDTVADIGAGTGIFTCQISEKVKQVYAVEPNEHMRSKGESLTGHIKNILFINATAEHTGIKDNSIDVVTVAQAFHWFDRAAFKKECKRILKPNGKVILIWNNRDENDEIIVKNFEINEFYCKNFRGSSNGFDFGDGSFDDFFADRPKVVSFENILTYDAESFIARNLSSSYAPKETDENYNNYINALKLLFSRYALHGKIRYPYITKCFIGFV